ncbi:hypothetical protein GDO78_019446 [Eleutherodactylus coqui]|uniref:Centromere protein Q n=1 Tax=Eleutherodactylus coqui TaxID=57060 RepID=A0A8J6EIK9_ELECQ|nr:hypothetical protein GDO78_019446 [Eleutherodactylus coqui]
MAPKRQSSTTMKTVKPSSDTNVRKRKNPDSQEQTSRKRQRQNSKDKAMRLIKGKNVCPLKADVIQHIESCMNTAVMSVLGRKQVTAFEPVQVHLSRLKQRLLQLCKNMKLPATKLGNLRNLAKDLQEEQHRMEKYEDTLESLNIVVDIVK